MSHLCSGEDLTPYRADSERVEAAIEACVSSKCVVERGGLDEFWVDVSEEVQSMLADPATVAALRSADWAGAAHRVCLFV